MKQAHDLLFLSHRMPYPPDKGEKIRAWNILLHLARSRRVHLGCLVDNAADLAHIDYLRSVCADVACFPVSPRWQKLRAVAGLRPGKPLSLGYFQHHGLQRWVDQKLDNGAVDQIYVFCSSMAQYVMRPAHKGGPGTAEPDMRRVLDMVDVDSAKFAAFAAQSKWPMRQVWAREARTLLGVERDLVGKFDRTLFVSPDECRCFLELAQTDPARVGSLENGVDLDYFSHEIAFPSPYPDDSPTIAFTGTMDYWPNVDAVCWFARDIMPELKRLHPRPRFYIVGANPAPEVRRLAEDPQVHVTGRVPDTRPYLAHANVVVAPLRIARGVQNKVLEAMALGRPVVATPQALEGIQAQSGRDLLIGTEPAEIGQLIKEVLSGSHAKIGSAARLAVSSAHDWNATLKPLSALFDPTGSFVNA